MAQGPARKGWFDPNGFGHPAGLQILRVRSQVETGFTRLPPQKVGAWGSAVGADPVRQAASFYEPELHRVLYEDKPG